MKIVSLLPSATEIVCALDLQENLIGVTHECDFPVSVAGKPHLTASRISHETMSSSEIDHAVRSQLDGHGSIYNLDVELLGQLKPDLIITQELCEVCAVSYKQVEKAARTYVADAQVISLEPNTIVDIFSNILTVGALTGASAKAERVVGELESRLENLRARTATIEKRPRVLMLEWLEPPFAPGHWTPEQVQIAGGICVLGEAGEKSVTTSHKAICESDPDVIVLVPCGYYTKDILRQLPKTFFPEYFQKISAFKNDEIWAMDASAYFSRPAPRVIDGAEILAKIFHPRIFGAPTDEEAIRVPQNLLNFCNAVD